MKDLYIDKNNGNTADITAVIPVKGDSSRLPHKNILPFADSNLLLHKIRQLKEVKEISRIVVSSESDELLSMAESEGVAAVKRPMQYADESLPICEFVSWLGRTLEGEHIMWACVTSPLVGPVLYKKAIDIYFEKLKEGYDSLATVTPFKHYLMDELGPFNFSRGRGHTNSQNLRKLYLFTNGIQLTPREKYIEWEDRIGPKAYLMEVGRKESIDIDDIYDYKFAVLMYEEDNK